MDKLTLDNTRDLPMTTNTLAFMQAAYAIFEQLGNIGGSNIIVSGCAVTGSSVSTGYMFLKGKLMPFVGGAIQTNVKIVTVVNDVAVDAGVRQQTSYRAEFGTSTNADENVAWADILKIDTIKDIMVQISEILGLIENLDTDILANAEDIQTNADAISSLFTQLDEKADKPNWSSRTNIGGNTEAEATLLNVDARVISILTSVTSNDWIKLPSESDQTLYAGQPVTIKAKSTSTNNLYVAVANTDLTGARTIAPRDSATFVWTGSVWEILTFSDN